MSTRLIDKNPPSPSFSNSKPIASLRQQFKNQNIKNSILILEEKYSNYRKTREDGNSLYRAVAYYELVQNRFYNMKDVFYGIDREDIITLYQQSIPVVFKQFYRKKPIIYMLEENWDQKMKKYMHNTQPERALILLLNTYAVFDFILVAFYRSKCFLLCNRQTNKKYYQSCSQNNEIKNINSYGTQGENIAIRILADSLKTNILIHQISGQYTQTLYQYQNSQKTIYLLRFSNSYHLLQNPKPNNFSNHQLQQTYNKKLRTKTYKLVMISQSISPQIKIQHQQKTNNNNCQQCKKLSLINEYKSFLCFRCQILQSNWKILQKLKNGFQEARINI